MNSGNNSFENLDVDRASQPAPNTSRAFLDIVNSNGRTQTAPEIAAQFPRWKRVLDLTCIAISLPFWLPLMALIALGIQFISPGAVFFRQERMGYRGRRFTCLKFRSMKVNAETTSHERYLHELIDADAPMTKLDAAGDPRLIPFGRIFRATGLDELPQLLNVIRGDMSLVGPRPCTTHEFEHYNDCQRERLNAPPGLTGYWQVSGKNRTTFSEMVAMDIYYANKMSVWMDLGIMLRTVPAIIGQIFGSQYWGRPENKTDSGLNSNKRNE